MKKKILLGSLLVITLLLLMPSIPAIQQKTLEDKAFNDFYEVKDFDELFASVRMKLADIISGVDIGILGPGGAFILWLLDMIDRFLTLVTSIVEFGVVKFMIWGTSLVLLMILANFVYILRMNGYNWELARDLLWPIVTVLYYIVYGELPPFPD